MAEQEAIIWCSLESCCAGLWTSVFKLSPSVSIGWANATGLFSADRVKKYWFNNNAKNSADTDVYVLFCGTDFITACCVQFVKQTTKILHLFFFLAEIAGSNGESLDDFIENYSHFGRRESVSSFSSMTSQGFAESVIRPLGIKCPAGGTWKQLSCSTIIVFLHEKDAQPLYIITRSWYFCFCFLFSELGHLFDLQCYAVTNAGLYKIRNTFILRVCGVCCIQPYQYVLHEK